MNLIHDRVKFLDDNKKRLILEIIDNFLPEDDEAMPHHLDYIELARQEYANGETTSHNDIKWK